MEFELTQQLQKSYNLGSYPDKYNQDSLHVENLRKKKIQKQKFFHTKI